MIWSQNWQSSSLNLVSRWTQSPKVLVWACLLLWLNPIPVFLLLHFPTRVLGCALHFSVNIFPKSSLLCVEGWMETEMSIVVTLRPCFFPLLSGSSPGCPLSFSCHTLFPLFWPSDLRELTHCPFSSVFGFSQYKNLRRTEGEGRWERKVSFWMWWTVEIVSEEDLLGPLPSVLSGCGFLYT